MLKKELVRKVAKSIGMTQKVVDKVIDGYHEAVIDTVAGGQDVKLVGFGTYGAKKVSAKDIKLRGKIIHAEEKYKPKFVSAKDFTERVIEGRK